MKQYYVKEKRDINTGNVIDSEFLRLQKDFKGKFIVPNSVSVIGKRAFANCSGLTSVELPSTLKTIKDEAFVNTGLKKIVIPGNIEVIPRRAFADCKNLSDVVLSASLKEIGKEAFSGCSSMTGINFPERLESIGPDAFNHCGLKNIEIGANVKSIGRRAFSYNDADVVRIGASVNWIGDRAFWMNDPRTVVVDVDNKEFCDGGYNAILERETGKVVFCGSKDIPDEAIVYAKKNV